jgi:DNA-binding beta-propeller fold protein YncE
MSSISTPATRPSLGAILALVLAMFVSAGPPPALGAAPAALSPALATPPLAPGGFGARPQAPVPRVTVIVDNLPPVRFATGIALDPTGTLAWVSEETIGEGRLVRVNLATGAVAPVATGLNQPGHFVVSGSTAFLAGNIGTPVTLVKIDLDDGTVTPVSNELGGGLSGVAVNAALTRAHVVNFGSGVLSRVDIDPGSPTFKQVTPVASGLAGPRDIATNSTGNIAYVTEQNAGRLVQVNINPASPDCGEVTLIAGGLDGQRGLTLNQGGTRVYLAEEGSRELSMVDVDPGSPGYGTVSTILTGPLLRDVALSSDEHRAVVTDAEDGVLVVDIDPASPHFGQVIDYVTPAPLDGARGLWVNGSRTRAYVVSEFSGVLSRVVIDATAPAFGQTERLAKGLDVPVDVQVDAGEQTAYVAREQGPDRGANTVSRVELATGQISTVTDSAGQPVNLHFAPDPQAAYAVDLANGKVHHIALQTGALTTRLTGLTKPFGMDLAPDAVTAYIVTEPAAPVFPPGDLIRANLNTGAWSIIASDVVNGATSVVLNQAGSRAYFTQFGNEGACTGKLSWIDIVPSSPAYLSLTDILTGLCGPHDLDVRMDERQFYVVLVDGKQLIRVDLAESVYLPMVLRNPAR